MKWLLILSLPLLMAPRCQVGACCGSPPPGPDLADRYCATLTDGDNVRSMPVDVSQSGDDVTFYTEEVNLSGTFYGQSIAMQGVSLNGEKVSANVYFQFGIDSFTGELCLPNKTYAFNGVAGHCYDYQEVDGRPGCILPFTGGAPIDDGQQYNAVFNNVRHTGVDFAYAIGTHEIRAPCDGVVTGLYQEMLSLGNIAHSVELRFNKQWRVQVGIEPYSPDPLMSTQQHQAIIVLLNQVLKAGDVLGFLIAPDTVFPHIHWQMNQVIDAVRTDTCPADFLIAGEADRLDNLSTGLGRAPACYATPTVVGY